MTTKRFTLIELLTVIAIIAILAGLLLPALGTIKDQAKRTKAKAQMKALELAIKSYETSYGILPNLNAEATDDSLGRPGNAASRDAYDTLLQVLTKTNIEATGSSVPGRSNYGNDRSIRFLDVTTEYAPKGYIDPWGNRYVVTIDFGYDNQITLPTYNPTTTVYGTVGVYSLGKDGEDDEGRSSGANGSDKYDDIPSWE